MKKVVIIGAGRAGCSIAKNLQESDKFQITAITDINGEIARESGDFIGDVVYTGTDNNEAVKYGDIVIISTPDDYIESTCNTLSEKSFIENKFIFHLSGSRPSTVLSSARKQNCFIGSMHPLQSMPSPEAGYENLKNAFFCIEGDKEAVEIGKIMASQISGKFFTIDTREKSLYHAAAVFASNFINTVVFASFSIFKDIGVPEKDILEIISPLIKGTVNNIEKLGVVNSLTGPVVRGDIKTVEAHIKGFEESDNGFLELYRILTEHTINLASLNSNAPDKAIIKQLIRILNK